MTTKEAKKRVEVFYSYHQQDEKQYERGSRGTTFAFSTAIETRA